MSAIPKRLACDSRMLGVVIAVLVCLTNVVSCGGGFGDPGPDAYVYIHTPPDDATLQGPATVLSGSAYMKAFGAYPTGSVFWSNTSNGTSGVADATVSCFFQCQLNWSAEVPLAFGANAISVSYFDGADSITVTRAVSISGRITIDGGHMSVPSIVVIANPANKSSSTDREGRYRIAMLTAGTQTLTPQQLPPPRCGECVHLTPANRVIDLDGTMDVIDQDFVATMLLPWFTVSGRVTPSTDHTIGLAGVGLGITDASGASYGVLTGGNGTFEFIQLPPGTYTVTPTSYGDTTFIPPSRTITIGDSDVMGQDFRREL
jgi:hypothetical protein